MAIETIEKDDLTEVARNIECLSIMLGDILTEYFDRHQNEDDPEQARGIIWDFDRYRKYTSVCFDIVYRTKQELHEKGIICYKDRV